VFVEWHDLIKTALEAAFVSMASVAAGAIVTWLVRVAQRAGLEVTAEQQAQLINLAKQAILKAEEYAAQQLKTQAPLSSSAKLQIAVEHMTDAGVTKKDAVDVIQATLPTVGLGATAPVVSPPNQVI
jgi:hypothetical protein